MTGAEVRQLRPASDDRAAFESTYRAHAPAVLGYLARRVGDPADAADLLAEVFLIAWRRRADLPEDDGLRPWLFVVARNLLTDHHRRGTRRARLTAPSPRPSRGRWSSGTWNLTAGSCAPPSPASTPTTASC